jgi:TolB-like protein/Tfp pilus assembly protein PilF
VEARRPAVGSIAVLPLEGLPRDPEQEYLLDGITEELITDLSKIDSVRVISRSSVMRYKGSHQDLAAIARELKVDAILAGTLIRFGNRIRISAQLVQLPQQNTLWADSYERNLDDILGLQAEVARTVAGQIRGSLTPEEHTRLSATPRVDPEVHQLVLRGDYYADKNTEDAFKKALDYFEQAIALDPNYAPAHAGVALVYRNLASFYLPPREVMPKAKAAAEKALRLDETLSDVHLTLASVLLFYDWDWPEAEKHLKRALELNPSSANAHVLYGSYFTAQGQPQKALAELRLAQALDPLSLLVQGELLFCLLSARQFDQVIEQAHRTLEREPTFAIGYAAAALAYGEKGEFDRAIESMEKATRIESNTSFTAMSAHVQAAKGNRQEAEKLLAELKALRSRRYVCAYEVAHAYVKLGDKQQAFEWLEKGKQDRSDCMVWLLSEPWMDPLRGERPYRDLIAHIGLGTGKAGQKP